MGRELQCRFWKYSGKEQHKGHRQVLGTNCLRWWRNSPCCWILLLGMHLSVQLCQMLTPSPLPNNQNNKILCCFTPEGSDSIPTPAFAKAEDNSEPPHLHVQMWDFEGAVSVTLFCTPTQGHQMGSYHLLPSKKVYLLARPYHTVAVCLTVKIPLWKWSLW